MPKAASTCPAKPSAKGLKPFLYTAFRMSSELTIVPVPGAPQISQTAKSYHHFLLFSHARNLVYLCLLISLSTAVKGSGGKNSSTSILGTNRGLFSPVGWLY